MRLFGRKKRVPISEIINSLLTALNDACEMQQLRQMQSADNLTDTESGESAVKRLKIGDQTIEIPLASLVSMDTMEIKEINVCFQGQIQDLLTRAISSNSMTCKPITYDNLEFIFDKATGYDDDSIKISILFNRKKRIMVNKTMSEN